MKRKPCPHGYSKLRCSRCRTARIIEKADPKISKSRIKKELDIIFSLNVRLRGCSDNLVGFCFSCRKVLPFTKLQNGHYVSRSISQATYFNHDNCRPQCVVCNKWKEGNTLEYRRYLIQDIGLKKVELIELMSRSDSFRGLTAFEMKVRIKEEIAELKKHILRTGLELGVEAKRIIKKWDA